MISVRDAFETIIEGMRVQPGEHVPVQKCISRVLCQDVLSDIPMPPFDRSAMDGFALRGEADSYELLPEIPAGTEAPPITRDGQAAPIMTGAPVPPGADRVVMVEATKVSGGRLWVTSMPGKGSNICWKAEDIRDGQRVLSSGMPITPWESGIASMAGKEVLRVFRRPIVSVLTSGSEVVPPVQLPGTGQVRNANGPMIAFFLGSSGFAPECILHAVDDPPSLRNALEQASKVSDVILTAGGVSMGTRDFIPSVVEDMGFEFHFRTVAQKPGKPFCFATRNSDGKAVFGLPGNPVSVIVALEMYVLPALRYSSGHSRFRRKGLSAKLETPLLKRPGRQTYYRANASFNGSDWSLEIPETSGSGDLMSTCGTNSLAWLPPDSTGADTGERIPFFLLSWAGGESCWE